MPEPLPNSAEIKVHYGNLYHKMGYAEHHWTAYVEVSYKGRKLNADKFISKVCFGLNATFEERKVDVRADEESAFKLERSS